MKQNLIVTAIVSILMAGFVLAYASMAPASVSAGTMATKGPQVPNVGGFAEGQPIQFIHTEASDSGVAKKLTDMMGSPVLVVPSLTQAPDQILANVYVFKNGIKGKGPFGFQPDVLDNPAGTDRYSPLRRLNLVSWRDERSAHELKSAADVKQAASKGVVSIERADVVINMPMITWPGGKR